MIATSDTIGPVSLMMTDPMENEHARKYYTLCERAPGQLWSPEFGDYSKAVVEQEMRDMKDSGSFKKGTQFKIIVTSGKQANINAAVERAKL